LPGERDNTRNNARCTQARKATHGLDGQHQDVDRTLHERVNQNDRGQRWYTRPQTVTHPSTKRARRALTSFMRRTPLSTAPRHAASTAACTWLSAGGSKTAVFYPNTEYATLSSNSLRQTVHTHRASVHHAAKLIAALLRVAGVDAGLAESNDSLPPGL